jgi:PAS domain S-box-containing protein
VFAPAAASPGPGPAAFLRRLHEAVARATDIEAVHQAALDALSGALGIERAAILLRDPDDVLRFKAWRGLSEAYRRAVEGHVPWDLDDPDPRPIAVRDVTQDPGLAGYAAVFQADRIRSLAFVPLRHRDRLVGKFMLYLGEPHDFTVEELDIAGAIAGHIAYALDRHRMEGELGDALHRANESEGRLRLALEAAGFGTWEWLLSTNHVHWSPELEGIHGLEPSTFPGTFDAVQEEMLEEDRQRVLEAVQAALLGAGEYRVEYRIRRRDGQVRWVEGRGRLLHESGGPRMIGVCSDVTARKELELAQRRGADRLRFLSRAMQELADALDDREVLDRLAHLVVPDLADYAVVYALEGDRLSRAGVAHCEPEMTEAVRELGQLEAPGLGDSVGAGKVVSSGRAILASVVEDEQLVRAASSPAHLAVLRRLGPVSSIVAPLRARGRTVGAVALCSTRASGRVYREEDLILAEELASRAALLADNARLYRDAQAAVRARDDVVAVLSHDLRNPLAAILTATSLLELHGSEPDGKSITTIRRAGARMQRLISDLLDVSRIEAGRLVLDRQPLELAPIVQEACALVSQLAEAKSATVEQEIARDLPQVLADRDRIAQVLANLVGNAVKFVGEGGHVRIRAFRSDGRVRVSVQDDGVGIPATQLPFVFDRFWKGEHGEGSGLGLAIVRGVVEAHGGKLGVESELGRGSIFWFEL